MADLQTTLSLVLQGKDEASVVLQKVGTEMAKLATETSAVQEKLARQGLSVGNIEAIAAVTKQRTALVKQNVDEQIKELRKAEQQASTSARAETQEVLRQSRESRDQTIADARKVRDEKLAALKQETALSKAERATREKDTRDEANRTMAQARADHAELMRLYREDERVRIAAAQQRTGTEIVPLRQAVPYVQAGAESLRADDRAAAELKKQTAKEAVEAEKLVAQAAKDAAAAKKQADREAAQAAKDAAAVIKQADRETAQSARETARARKEADHAALQGTKEYDAALHRLKSTAESAFGPLGHLVEMGRQMLVWGIGYQAVMSVYSAAMQAAGGLITTNVQLEQLSMTFAAIYQTNATQGRAMITWLDQFATKVPGTRQEVREAALAFAAAGDNVQQMLPAVSNLAAIMGTDLPTAAHAMVDAQMGRFEMLQTTLKTTKTQLQAYGLEVDRVGHVTAGTFVPAIERYVAARFGEHVAFDTRAVDTFQQKLRAAGMQTGATADLLQKAAMVQAGTLPGDATGAQRQAVLGQTVSALQQAQMGNITRLHEMYGVTAADLKKIDTGWQDTGASAEAAFVKWYAATHGGMEALKNIHVQQSAIQLQMETLGGAFSNIKDSLTNLQEVMGRGMFDVLKKAAFDLYTVLQSPAIGYFAHQVGSLLGDALQNGVNAFKAWFLAIGGLPGLLHLITTVGRDAWAVVQGLGDTVGELGHVLSMVMAPVQVVLSALGIIGDRSRDGAGAIRFLTSAVVDLFVALKVAQGIAAVGAVFGAMAATIQRVTTALREAVIAQRALAESQKIAAVTAVAETAAEMETAGALRGVTTASEAAAIGGRRPSGILLPRGAAMAGEGAVVAGAEAAEAVGVLEMATTGLGALAAAALATLGPIALVVAGFAALAFGISKVKEAIDTANQRAKVEPFLVPKDIKLPSTSESAANSLASAAFGGAMGGTSPVATGITESPSAAFLRYLPQKARALYAQADQGTGTALAEHERAWMEYLSEHPKVLKHLNEMLKAALKPQMSMQQVQRTLAGLEGYSQADVNAALKTQTQTLEHLKADIDKHDPEDIIGRLSTLKDATYQVTLARTGSIEKAVGASLAIEKKWVQDHWSKLPEDTQKTLIAMKMPGVPGQPPGSQATYTPEKYQQNIQQEQGKLTALLQDNAPWEEIRNAFGSVQEVARRGVHEASQSAQSMLDTIRAAIQQISQHFAQKLKWDESLGMPMTVLRQDVEDWIGHLQEIHTPLEDIAKEVVPSILELAQQDIPDLVKAAPDEVAAYFATLKRELASSGLNAAQQAAAFAKVYSDFQKAQVQQIEQELQTAVSLGTVSVGDETSLVDKAIQGRLKINADAIKAHKPAPYSENDIALFRKQSLDAIAQPAVQAAQTTLQYDEMIKAPWSKIVADINAYSAALSRTSLSANEQQMLVQQAWQSARQKLQQNIELQLQFDQMMGASFGTILSDIVAMGKTMAAEPGADPRAVAIRMHDLITQATETHLQEAVASGASLQELHHILDDGTTALRNAGLSRVAVERWAAQEIRNVVAARIQQEQAAGRAAFELDQTRGRIRTPQDVMQYVNAQRILERQLPGPPGETDKQRQVRQTTDMNQVIQAGFQGIIDRQQKQFEFDTGPGGNVVSALKDENLIIKYSQLQWKALGMSPDDMKLSTNLLRRQLDQQRLGGQPVRPEPAYTPYGRLGHEPGFQAADIYFGHPATNALTAMVAQLRQMVDYWRSQAEAYKSALEEAKKTTRNTHETAQGVRTLVQKQDGATAQPSAPSNVTSQIRGRGGWTPI